MKGAVMRRLCALIACLLLCACSAQVPEPVVEDAPASDQQASTDLQAPSEARQMAYVEREVALFEGTTRSGTVTARFLDERPDVCYLGLAQYMGIVFDEQVQVSVEGTQVKLVSHDGGTLVADGEADTLYSPDWLAFRNYLEPMREGKVTGYVDCGVPFVRVSGITVERAGDPVTFDLGAYGIDVYVDEQDVWLPVSLECDIMADVSMSHLSYNGSYLALERGFQTSSGQGMGSYYDNVLSGGRRPSDVVDESYAELCFCIDCLYGRTGRGILDEALASQTLDEVLSTTDDATREVRDMLRSSDMATYLCGLLALNDYLQDGHTVLWDTDLMRGHAEERVVSRATDLYHDFQDRVIKREHPEVLDGWPPDDDEVAAARERAFPDGGTYHELNDTAMISLDSFMDVDRAGWEAYYAGEGAMPDGTTSPDLIGTLVSGLARASANPNIKHVVLDVSLNEGGYNDLCAAAVAIACDKTTMCVHDMTSDARYTVDYEVDTDLDGSFEANAASKARGYDLAVLTSKVSFSCGNLFPSELRDAGVYVLGERSSGGTDMCARMVTPEGIRLQLAGSMFEMCDERWNMIESGVPLDCELVTHASDGTADYSRLYDLEYLSEVLGGLTGEQALDEAA